MRSYFRMLLSLLAVVTLLIAHSPTQATAASPITLYNTPVDLKGPFGITTGPDGALWIAAFENKIARLAPDGSFKVFPVPAPANNAHSTSITTGPDGALWFTLNDSGQLGRITPNGTITLYALPDTRSAPRDITAGPDGNLWFVEEQGNRIGRITTAGLVTEFSIPTDKSRPWNITLGPDGNLWFTEAEGHKIGRITPTGTITEFPLLSMNVSAFGITSGPDQNVWFTQSNGKIGRITPGGSLTEFTVPRTSAGLNDIVAGPDGGLWYTATDGNLIGRITTNGTVMEYAIPTALTPPTLKGPERITIGPDGNLWFTMPLEAKVGKMQLPAPVPHDERYYSATGYRIDDDQIWRYFQSRGGVDTFGYPVSRTFWLLGLPVQIFQRQALQIWPDGSVHPLNLLDPELMPVTSINFSTFPAHDPAVAQAAPKPETPNYGQAVQHYLQANVPDSWNSVPVQFLQTYLGAAPGNAGNLRFLLALEVWGFPTSQPMADPNNPNFIYQRFQRGILHYDATTHVTRGILLADALKSVLLGQGPADLQLQMQGSRFFKQYCPGQPRALCRPDVLPNTNLTFAFEQQ